MRLDTLDRTRSSRSPSARNPHNDPPEVLPSVVTFLNVEDRRGNYIFLGWIGDHSPRHVHVYRDGNLVVKWDLDNWPPMKGKANKRIERLLQELVEEGLL